MKHGLLLLRAVTGSYCGLICAWPAQRCRAHRQRWQRAPHSRQRRREVDRKAATPMLPSSRSRALAIAAVLACAPDLTAAQATVCGETVVVGHPPYDGGVPDAHTVQLCQSGAGGVTVSTPTIQAACAADMGAIGGAMAQTEAACTELLCGTQIAPGCLAALSAAGAVYDRCIPAKQYFDGGHLYQRMGRLIAGCAGGTAAPPPPVPPPPPVVVAPTRPQSPTLPPDCGDLGQSAEAITAVCCAGAKCTAARPIPGTCSSPCAELMAPLARRCGGFLAEHMPALIPLTQLCLERAGGIGSGTIEPAGDFAWPPCAHDDADFGASACEASIANGLSCGSLFCPECGGLAHKCDATCGFPCPTEGVQYPPGQPFLLCFEATCGSPSIDRGQVRELRLTTHAVSVLLALRVL